MTDDLEPTVKELVERLCEELEWSLTIVEELDPSFQNQQRASYALSIVRILQDRLDN